MRNANLLRDSIEVIEVEALAAPSVRQRFDGHIKADASARATADLAEALRAKAGAALTRVCSRAPPLGLSAVALAKAELPDTVTRSRLRPLEPKRGPAFLVECTNTTGQTQLSGDDVWPLLRSAILLDGQPLRDRRFVYTDVCLCAYGRSC